MKRTTLLAAITIGAMAATAWAEPVVVRLIPLADDSGNCSRDGWCEDRRGPPARDINGIWVGDGQTAIAVGNGGFIERLDGEVWTSMDSNTRVNLRAVWGNGPDLAVAVGDGGTILRYDGRQWSAMASGTSRNLRAVWGSGDDDIYAVGFRGTVLHFDGRRWQPLRVGSSLSLRAVWGTGPDDVFVTGLRGIVLHFDGSRWAQQTRVTGQTLSAVWGRAPDDVYAAGVMGTLVRYDGSSWRSIATGTQASLAGLSGDQNVAYTVGDSGTVLRIQGENVSGQVSGTTTDLRSLGILEETGQAVAVGRRGIILRRSDLAPPTGQSPRDTGGVITSLGTVRDGVAIPLWGQQPGSNGESTEPREELTERGRLRQRALRELRRITGRDSF